MLTKTKQYYHKVIWFMVDTAFYFSKFFNFLKTVYAFSCYSD